MERIINITCPGCNYEFNCEPYLSKPRIVREGEPLSLSEWSTAVVEARAICPYCGLLINKTCTGDIYPDDIISLAIRRYERTR